jgi:hypothetical protein
MRRARGGSDVDIPAVIERSIGAAEHYARIDSRYLLLEISRQEEILAPETKLVESLGDLEGRRAALPFPWALKADGTTGGAGVRVAHTAEEAKAHYVELRRSMGLLRSIKHLTQDRDLILEEQWRSCIRRVPPTVIAQSFIRGRAANCAASAGKGQSWRGLAARL